MRPGQQNNKNRMRGRNRKGPNPLTRSYESNGPDVKIRGTALHIAEKYVQLARDAQSSGDRVAGESYLQHAEHYYRIIMAAQAANPQPQQPQFYRNDEGDDEGDGDEHPFGQQRPQNGYPHYQQGNDGQQHFNGNNNGYAGQSHNDQDGGDDRPYQPEDRQPQQSQPQQHQPQPNQPQQNPPQQGQPQQNQQPRQGGDFNSGGEFQGLPGGTGPNGEFRNRRRRSNRRGRRGEGGNFGGEEQRSEGGQPNPEFQTEE